MHDNFRVAMMDYSSSIPTWRNLFRNVIVVMGRRWISIIQSIEWWLKMAYEYKLQIRNIPTIKSSTIFSANSFTAKTVLNFWRLCIGVEQMCLPYV